MIEFDNVHLRYGRKEVLTGISMLIPDGHITAILGPSGSGKSTILRLMLGLIPPTSGRVIVDGRDISRLGEEELFPIRRTMGMVFQGNALFDSLSVAENMGFFLRENLNLPEDEVQRRIQGELRFAGMESHQFQLPASLSGGMRKRIAIGRALIFGPRTVLLDEPTVGLDPVAAKKILDLIQSLREKKGLGAIMITHLINDVFGVADRVLILYQGKFIFDDVPGAMQGADHPFIQSFLVNPEGE